MDHKGGSAGGRKGDEGRDNCCSLVSNDCFMNTMKPTNCVSVIHLYKVKGEQYECTSFRVYKCIKF